MADQEQLAQLARQIVPELKSSDHKGQSGRIGVVGGSEE